MRIQSSAQRYDTDLLVAGAGGGLAGALRAAQLGLSVVVVEPNEHYLRANNTAMSTAMIPGAGSRYQRAAQIADSPQRFLADIERKTNGTADAAVASALARVSAELVEWLADHAGIPVELPTDFSYPGHCAQRVHTVPGRRGEHLLRYLSQAIQHHPRIDLIMPARLTRVRPPPRHGPMIACVEYPDGTQEEISAGSVLMATSGFGAAEDLVHRHIPEIAGAAYHGSEYATGDALRMGISAGAQTTCLDSYQGHAGLSAAARALVTWTTVMHGGFLVNRSGCRFGDETRGYSEYAAVLAAQPSSAGWLILDGRIHDLSLAFADYQDVASTGAVRTCDTVEGLAEMLSVPVSALHRELAEATAVADGTRPADRFGRSQFEAPLRAPFKAVRVIAALFHTQGGLRVDRHGRVLAACDSPIPRLYASGGAAAGISGRGADGYLGGNGLLSALGLAYLAATHAASRLSTSRQRAEREDAR